MIAGRGGMSISRHRKVARHKVPALNAASKAAIARVLDALALMRTRRQRTVFYASVRECFEAARRRESA